VKRKPHQHPAQRPGYRQPTQQQLRGARQALRKKKEPAPAVRGQLLLTLGATTKAHRYLENAVRAKRRGAELAVRYYIDQAVQPKGARP